MKKWLSLFVTVLLVIGSGCHLISEPSPTSKQPSEPKTSEKRESYRQEKLKRALTETEKQLMNAPGSLSGPNYNEQELKRALDQLPAQLTAEQYYQELMKLLAEDYRPYVTHFVNFDPIVRVDHERPDEKIVLPPTKKLHVSILLDASGSMAGKVKQKEKMTSAKEAILQFVEQLPKNATVSLRVYGHKGTGSQKDKILSCNSTEELYHSVGVHKNTFQAALQKVQPAGWTPIAKALESVKTDINPNTTDSIVYVVSDGIETCDGDPVKIAKELNQSQVQTIVNIIGFDVDNKGQTLLKQVADAGNGRFAYVSDEKALKDFLNNEYNRLKNDWLEWKEKGKRDAISQKEQKKNFVMDNKEKMKTLAEREKAHLKFAHNYLDEKLGDNYPENEIFDRILKRHNLAWNYAVDTGNRLYNETVESGNKVWNDFVDEGNQKINEAIEKKNQ